MTEPMELYIEVSEMRPLPSGEKFAAKVVHYYVKTDEGEQLVKGPGTEFWGYTAEEARQAAEEAFYSTPDLLLSSEAQ